MRRVILYPQFSAELSFRFKILIYNNLSKLHYEKSKICYLD